MRVVAALVLAFAAAGCGGGGAGGRRSRRRRTACVSRLARRRVRGRDAPPSVPRWWRTGSSGRLGTLLSDDRSRHPAFVSVRYLDDSLPARRETFADVAARTLRPPAGHGLTLLYTRRALLGGRAAVEAPFVWQTKGDTPIGPTFRTFGVGTASDRTAFLVFAAERVPLHAGTFGWIRKSIRWDETLPSARSPTGRHATEP